MSPLQTIVSGLQAIAAHRMRSLLTSLGILIGVGAVIITVGIGLGTRTTIAARISRLGTNLITVTPGSVTSGGVRTGLGSATTLTLDDARALGDHSVVPDVEAVAPVVQRTATTMTAGSQNWTAAVTGSTPGWLLANARQLDSGDFLTDADVRSHAHVAVLGPTTAQNLFPGGNAVGSLVTIQQVPFRIVGVLVPRGAQGLFNPDDLAVVPLTTAQGQLIAGGSLTTVQRILLSATSRDTIDTAYQEVSNLLMTTHRIADPSQADFTVTTQQSILDTLDSTSTALTLLLAGVAGISLLVGGIGVMNIMLVSVTERVAEIGLRKAVGATRNDILRQFLIEAASLGAAGGVLGVGLGLVSTILLNHYTPVLTVFAPAAAIAALLIASGIGLVFGVFPAVRAARLTPIDALRT
ncbi:MAG: putative transport system permease protein [Chloroflexota bacterium]|jgi:putative ABC transport system permease protein|nr:putative transport system permease protein [Chloroflexota bacterium]